jgi:hypothetical protein
VLHGIRLVWVCSHADPSLEKPSCTRCGRVATGFVEFDRGSLAFPFPGIQCYLYNKPAHHEIARYLLARKPELGAMAYREPLYLGETILHIAIINKSFEQVQFIVDNYPELVTKRATGGFFAQGNTCYYGVLRGLVCWFGRVKVPARYCSLQGSIRCSLLHPSVRNALLSCCWTAVPTCEPLILTGTPSCT